MLLRAPGQRDRGSTANPHRATQWARLLLRRLARFGGFAPLDELRAIRVAAFITEPVALGVTAILVRRGQTGHHHAGGAQTHAALRQVDGFGPGHFAMHGPELSATPPIVQMEFAVRRCVDPPAHPPQRSRSDRT